MIDYHNYVSLKFKFYLLFNSDKVATFDAALAVVITITTTVVHSITITIKVTANKQVQLHSAIIRG